MTDTAFNDAQALYDAAEPDDEEDEDELGRRYGPLSQMWWTIRA